MGEMIAVLLVILCVGAMAAAVFHGSMSSKKEDENDDR